MKRLVRALMLRVVVVLMPLAVICTYSHVTPTQTRTVAVDVVPTAEIDDTHSTIGIADSSLYGLSPADIDKTLTQLQSIGVQNIRVFVPWALIKMTGPNDLPNDANWTLMNNVMDAARAHNMGVLAVISHTPLWAAPSGTIPGAGAPDPAVYADFVKQVATRYGDVISAYEVWNEPNSFTFFQPMDPVKYTAILKAVYTTLKGGDGVTGVDPTSTVIAGALAPLQDFFGATASPQTFLAAMYAAGAKGFFDAISFHPYEFNQVLKFSQGALNPLAPLYQLQQMRAIMVQNGDGQKLIWATEYGFQTVLDQLGVVDPTSNQKQADFISDFITAWRALTYTGPMFIYTTRDGVPGTDTGYGIFQADWTAKLAVKVISDAIGLPPVVVSPIVALAQLIQKAVAQFQKTFASFTTSLQTAFANAVKAFQSLLSGIFKPAAAQPATTAGLAPAAASISADTLSAANRAATELKSQVGGSKDTTDHVKAGDKSDSGDVKTVDAVEHEAAGATDPKAVEAKAEDPKTTDPKTTDPKTTDPKAEDLKAETPKAETPKEETPKVETPKAETPKAETPKAETPQTDSPASTEPKATTESKPAKDNAAQDKSTDGTAGDKAGAKGKGKKQGKTKKPAPAASEPSKPTGRSNSDTGKTSTTDGKSHQHQGA